MSATDVMPETGSGKPQRVIASASKPAGGDEKWRFLFEARAMRLAEINICRNVTSISSTTEQSI